MSLRGLVCLIATRLWDTLMQRARAEIWLPNGKEAVKLMPLSCHRFRANGMRLWLSVIAYNWETWGAGSPYRSGSAPGR